MIYTPMIVLVHTVCQRKREREREIDRDTCAKSKVMRTLLTHCDSDTFGASATAVEKLLAFGYTLEFLQKSLYCHV